MKFDYEASYETERFYLLLRLSNKSYLLSSGSQFFCWVLIVCNVQNSHALGLCVSKSDKCQSTKLHVTTRLIKFSSFHCVTGSQAVQLHTQRGSLIIERQLGSMGGGLIFFYLLRLLFDWKSHLLLFPFNEICIIFCLIGMQYNVQL